MSYKRQLKGIRHFEQVETIYFRTKVEVLAIFNKLPIIYHDKNTVFKNFYMRTNNEQWQVYCLTYSLGKGSMSLDYEKKI